MKRYMWLIVLYISLLVNSGDENSDDSTMVPRKNNARISFGTTYNLQLFKDLFEHGGIESFL